MTEDEKKIITEDLKQQRQVADTAVAFITNMPSQNNDLAVQYLSQIKQPIELNNQEYIDNYCKTSYIGDFTFSSLHYKKSAPAQSTEKKSFPDLEHPKDILKSSDFYVLSDTNDPRWNARQLAGYSIKTDSIKLQKKDPLSPEEEQKYIELGFKNQSEYLKWNPVAITANLVHEGAHMKHMRYDGYSTLKKPIDIVKVGNLTEKIAFTAENLYAANQYSLLKKEGIKNIEINGEQQPIENILDMYPGLKETVAEQGFDPQNKKDVERVVTLSSDFWDKNRAKSYQTQHKNQVIINASADNLIQCCAHDDKQYDDVAKKMLQNTYIGNNTNIDLSDYRNILDNMTTDKAKDILAQEPIGIDLTYSQINNVNNYLDSINLKTEEEKMEYLKQNFEKITLRQEPYDEKLKEVMMQNGSKEHQNAILYADGLIEKVDDNGHKILSGKEGEVDITTYMQALKTSMHNAQIVQQHSLEQRTSELNQPEVQAPTPQQKHTTTLSPLATSMER